MGFLTAVAFVLVTIVSVIYAYFKYSFNYFQSRGIPCSEPSIPHGNTKGFGESIHPAIFLDKFYKKFKGTSKLFGVYFSIRPSIITTDLDLIKNVLIKDFGNFMNRGLYYNEKDDPLTGHLLSIDEEKWRRLRHKLTPTFTSGKMKFMFPTVVEVGNRFRDCLLDIVKDHDELEIKELLARYTTDVIGTCAFGIECNSLKDPNAEFRNMGRSIFEKSRHSMSTRFIIAKFGNVARRLHIKLLPDEISEFFMNVVRDTVEYREKNNVSRNDFMDLLIKMKNEESTDENVRKLTLDELAAQAFVFFIAGFETSSTTLMFCLYELALNPDIQAKCREKIREALKRHDGKYTYECMMDMDYVDQVLNETLRKYPPLTNLIRMAKNDYKVAGSDQIIESGMQVFILVYSIHHDEEYYPNPEKFDPDRFESEEVKKRHPMTWLPFGDGSRNCIGLRFGMMQVRIGLVTLLNNFEFSVSKRTPIPLILEPTHFIMAPKGGLHLGIKSIE